MPNDSMNFGVDLLPITDETYNLGDSNHQWIIYASEIHGPLSGNASSATAANITSNKYGIAYYSNTTGTFASTSAGSDGYVLIGKGANTAPNWLQATSSNTASTIVQRDASGNFSAGTITANLTGNATNVTGTVAVGHGGTNITSYTAGDILYASDSTTLSKLNLGSSGTFLKSNNNSITWSNVADQGFYLRSGSGIYDTGTNPEVTLYFLKDSSNATGNRLASIFITTTTVNSLLCPQRLYLRIYSYNSSTGAILASYGDQYRLPLISPNLSAMNTYEIITTKNLSDIKETNSSTAKFLRGDGNWSNVLGGAFISYSGSGVYHTSGDPTFCFLSYQSNNEAYRLGTIFMSSTAVNSKRVPVQMYFTQTSYNASTGALLSYRERYVLPWVATGLTGNTTYSIITTKGLKTTADCTASNNGLSANADTYFVRHYDKNDNETTRLIGEHNTNGYNYIALYIRNYNTSSSSWGSWQGFSLRAQKDGLGYCEAYMKQLNVQAAGDTYVTAINTSIYASNNTKRAVYLDNANSYHGLYSNGYGNGAGTMTLSSQWIIYRNNSGHTCVPGNFIITNKTENNVTSEGLISYAGTKATTAMIQFKDNTLDGNGNGILIGGGGVTIIGGGESYNTVYTNLANISSISPSAEQMFVCSDNDIKFYPNQQSGFNSTYYCVMNTNGFTSNIAVNSAQFMYGIPSDTSFTNKAYSQYNNTLKCIEFIFI